MEKRTVGMREFISDTIQDMEHEDIGVLLVFGLVGVFIFGVAGTFLVFGTLALVTGILTLASEWGMGLTLFTLVMSTAITGLGLYTLIQFLLSKWYQLKHQHLVEMTRLRSGTETKLSPPYSQGRR